MSEGLFATGEIVTVVHLWLAMRAQQRQQDWSPAAVFRGDLVLRLLGTALIILAGGWLSNDIGVVSTLLALTPALIAAIVFDVIRRRRKSRATRAR